MARGIGDALTELASRLAELGLVEAALQAAHEIGDEGDRARALAELGHVKEAPLGRLPEFGRVEESLEVAREIEDDWVRARSLARLAPQLAELPQIQVVPLWAKTLRLSETRLRSSLLAELGALAPVIDALGGSEAIAETCRAIHDVGRWWP